MDISYWQTQTVTKPLYPDIEWNKPERHDQAGRLAIIGGNKLGFAGVAEAYSVALSTGVGEVRAQPGAERLRLADVDDPCIVIAEAVDPGLVGDALGSGEPAHPQPPLGGRRFMGLSASWTYRPGQPSTTWSSTTETSTGARPVVAGPVITAPSSAEKSDP